MYGKIFDEQIS